MMGRSVSPLAGGRLREPSDQHSQFRILCTAWDLLPASCEVSELEIPLITCCSRSSPLRSFTRLLSHRQDNLFGGRRTRAFPAAGIVRGRPGRRLPAQFTARGPRFSTWPQPDHRSSFSQRWILTRAEKFQP